MSTVSIPNFGELLAPYIGSVPEQAVPAFLASLERTAADRYRMWAEAVPGCWSVGAGAEPGGQQVVAVTALGVLLGAEQHHPVGAHELRELVHGLLEPVLLGHQAVVHLLGLPRSRAPRHRRDREHK